MLSPARVAGSGAKHRIPRRNPGPCPGRPDNSAVHRRAERLAAAVLPLTLVAGAAALVVPSDAFAERSEWLLAELVALTALGIDPRRLAALRWPPASRPAPRSR